MGRAYGDNSTENKNKKAVDSWCYRWKKPLLSWDEETARNGDNNTTRQGDPDNEKLQKQNLFNQLTGNKAET